LIVAAKIGCKPIFTYLGDHGADLEAKDQKGLNALSWASVNEQAEIVDLILGGPAPCKSAPIELKSDFTLNLLEDLQVRGIGSVAGHGMLPSTEKTQRMEDLSCIQRVNARRKEALVVKPCLSLSSISKRLSFFRKRTFFHFLSS